MLPPHLGDDNQNSIIKLGNDLKHKYTKEVEAILAGRVRKVEKHVRRIQEFLVEWKNISIEETSWERAVDLYSATIHIDEFEDSWLTETSIN